MSSAAVLTAADQAWMARALELAERGINTTSPNPRVGCVIVRDGEVLGEGWHQRAGEGHAEVNALADAQAKNNNVNGATAYVTLEPCSHFGRTPPCAQALIDSGISRVVGALQDANPQVAGNGYQMLRNAGIEVVEACLSQAAAKLNAGFIQRMQSGKPQVTIKLAHSLDGRTAMASGESQWITGAAARADVQRLRARSCAVITGADSVLIDDPSMTVRAGQLGLDVDMGGDENLERQPLRVLIDGHNRVEANAKLFAQPGDILIVNTQPATQPIERNTALGKLEYWQAPATASGKVDINALLLELGRRGCNEVLVESGAQLAGAFVEQQLVDQLVLFCAPTILGSEARPLLSLPFSQMAQQIRWQWSDVRMVGNDLRLVLIPEGQAPEQPTLQKTAEPGQKERK